MVHAIQVTIIRQNHLAITNGVVLKVQVKQQEQSQKILCYSNNITQSATTKLIGINSKVLIQSSYSQKTIQLPLQVTEH